MAGYTKLFGSILESTVWLESPPVKVVWITMLAMADRDGLIEASVPGLAKRAGVERGDAERALALFLAPDVDSRTKDHEGRRLEAVSGGWRLLNYDMYRERASKDERAVKNAERQKRYRQRHPLLTVTGVTNVISNDIAPSPSPAPASKKKKIAPDGAFDHFWNAYPRKVGKDAARKAWTARRPDAVLSAAILEGLGRQRNSLRDADTFCPHPATWLRAGRWQDELAVANGAFYDWTCPHDPPHHGRHECQVATALAQGRAQRQETA